LDHLTSYQLSEWEAYDRIDPIGAWRNDYGAAMLASVIFSIARKVYGKKGQSGKELTPLDFMPDWAGEFKPEVKEQTLDQMKQAVLDMKRRFKKKPRRKDKEK